MKLNKIAQCIALMGIAGHAMGQTAPASSLQRVEITGSSIKRIAAQGALPVDIISREEIEKSGVTTAEQFLATLTVAGNGTDNLASLGGNASQGSSSNPDGTNNLGNSSANLRGLGSANTLILLNGRRLANHGLKGATVDLGAIPMGAIERVEVLRDGASAIYGTDAIGGVINFILRSNYNGLQLNAGTNVPQEGGGKIHKVSAVWGTGDLDADRYNVLVSLSKSKNDSLSADQRSFANLGHDPARGVAQESIGTPFATQTTSSTRLALRNTGTYSSANLLALQGDCASRPLMYPYADQVTGVTSRHYGCSYDYAGMARLQQPFEATNFVSRLNFQVSPKQLAFVEALASQTVARKEYEPNQVTSTSSAAANRYVYPVGGPYYQNLTSALAATPGTGMTFDPTKPIGMRWRCDECGNRTIDTTSSNTRFLVGLEGEIGGYDYKLGALTGSAKSKAVLIRGYMYADALNAALGSGLINPWLPVGGTQTAAGMAQLDSARADGLERIGGNTFVHQVDGTISGEVMQLPAGALAFALGTSWRREGYSMTGNDQSALYGTFSEANFPERTRDNTAVFAELLVPITKQLEATLAVRTDQYSDFGRTTNPKVSFRYQPAQTLLFRGSANTGFRAPSFGQLYAAATDINGTLPTITSARNDPTANCPAAGPDYCGVRFEYLTGGNPALRPEKSNQWSLGMVAEPTDWMTVSADLWEVKRTDVIGFLSPEGVLDNYSVLSSYAVRTSTGAIDYIRAGRINAAAVEVRGLDVGVNLRGKLSTGRWSASITGSYLDFYRDKLLESSPWVDRVGKFNNQDLRLRWKHNLSFTYTEGVWSGTVSQSYMDGYTSYIWPSGVTQAGGNVDSYTRYNLSGTYKGFKNTSINFGVTNLLNTAPPFSVHHSDEVSGTSWDPRIADPRGRSVFANVTMNF